MKKNIDPTFLTAKQLTDMINLLIHMIVALGHKIDIDEKSINKYLSNKKQPQQHDLFLLKNLFDQIEVLKKSLEKLN